MGYRMKRHQDVFNKPPGRQDRVGWMQDLEVVIKREVAAVLALGLGRLL